MGRIFPISTVAGLVSAFEDVDLEIASIPAGGTLTRAYLVCTDAPTGALSADVRNATGGGGAGLTGTIASGERSGSVTGSVTVAAGGTLYLRVTTANGALNLSGWVEVEEAGTTAAVYPVPTIAGQALPFVGVDVPITTIGGTAVLSRAYLVAMDAPSGTPLTADIRNATGGGGEGLSVSIAAGSQQGVATGAVVVAQGGTLYLRVTDDSAALNLSGFIELTDPSASLDDFTTLALVKDHAGITGTDEDARIEQLIDGVTAKMRSWMGRTISQTTVSGEKHSFNGWWPSLFLRHYPVQSISTLSEVGTTLTEGTHFATATATGVLTRLGATYSPCGWAKGHETVSVSYVGGYATVPDDIMNAATEQVRHEYHQMQPSGRNALGITAKGLDSGGQSLYVPGGSGTLLPATIEAMRPYRRLV